ncbi:MAG: SIS domain-containing protein [Candidatus Latescibacteria bacterium]|nr:SIS domain-containing protein [bacterium]MBD3423846.1 SIS domain-containing protein [Candidatus Latescibacterota bacterium]
MADYLLDQIRSEIGDLRTILESLPESTIKTVLKMAEVTAEGIINGKVVFTCGNGGSAADAQHIAGELVGRFRRKKVHGYKAIALTTNSSVVTALANDFSYREIFSKQLESRGETGDILLSLSTSGNSPNTVRAAEEAGKLGMITLAFVGQENGDLGDISDYVLNVPHQDFARIQETHMLMGHIYCGLVEEIVVSKG